MRSKAIRRVMVRALAAGAMVAGLSGVVAATSASALTFNTFYVSPHGTSSITNTCTNKAAPCLTIGQAVAADEAAVGGAAPSTISVAKGTYTENVSLSLAHANGITIVGKANAKGPQTTIKGSVTIASAADDITNVSVTSGVTLAGASTVGPGVVATNASGPAVAVANSSALVNGVTVSASSCMTTTKADMPYATGVATSVSNPFALAVKSIPKCAGTLSNTAITINGFTSHVDSAGGKNLAVISVNYGGGPPCGLTNPTCDAPTGSTVNFAPSVVPFSGAGIACTVSCNVENSTVDGVGTGAGINFPAGGTLSGNKVSGAGVGIAITTSAATGNVGTGACIGVCPVAPFTNTTGNTLSGDGYGITVAHGANGPGTSIAGNSVSGLLYGIKVGTVVAGDNLSLTGNTATGGTLGVGVALIGSKGVTIGGATPAAANTLSGSAVNVLLAGTGGTAATNNTIEGNAIDGGALNGVLVAGTTDQPSDVSAVLFQELGIANGVTNSPNTISNNELSGNGLSNIVDFGAFTKTSLAPTPGTITVCTAACSVGTGAIAPGASITTLNLVDASGPTTLTAGTVLEDASPPANPGTPITFYINGTCIVGTSGATCNVDSLIGGHFPLNQAGIGAGDTIVTSPLPNTASGNSFPGNYSGTNIPANAIHVVANGSATLDAASDAAGFVAG